MRRPLVVGLLVMVAAATLLATPLQTPSAPEAPPPFGPPAGWPSVHRLTEIPPTSQPAHWPLPTPSITEPFAIGEALHDPSRVADAVVSALSLLGIEFIPDDPAGVVIGGPRLRLQEFEVRALIDMGRADAEAQADDPSGPYTFSQLHKTVATFLPGVSVEDLAEAYTQEFERRPESVVPLVLMGQPLEPDTPLLRTELWLLLADRVLAQSPQRAVARARPGFVRVQALVQAPVQRMPTWDMINGSVVEYALRLPLILSAGLILTPVSGHEGHGGPGTRVTVEARIVGRAIRFTGTRPRPPLVPRQASLAGMESTWTTDDAIRKHAPSAPPSSRATVGAGGVARLVFTLRAEAARGRGQDMEEPGATTISVDMQELCSRLYSDPMCDETAGQKVSAQGVATLEWHAADVIEASITNVYDVGSKVAAFALTRYGVDGARIKLAREDDGTYRGGGELVVFSRTTMPGENCGTVVTWQSAEVVGVPIARDVAAAGLRPLGGVNLSMGAAFYTPVHTPKDYVLKSRGQPDVQLPTQPVYLRLEFFPRTRPAYRFQDGCHNEIPGPQSKATPNFVPLNDAQWTIEGSYGSGSDTNRAGYAIAVPDTGTITYEDHTSDNPMTVGPINLSGVVQAKSVWYLTITRSKASP